MLKTTKTIAEVEAYMQSLASKETAIQSQRFFKTGKGEYGEGDVFLGIRVPDIRKFVKRFKHLSLAETEILLTSRFHEIRLFALLSLVQQYQHADAEGKENVYQCYLRNTSFINNWDLVDSSAHYIVGPYLENRSRKILYSLALSDSLWERRIAIMSTLHFIKLSDFTDTLMLAKKLLHDEHDLVHKAVGWMLREVGNRDRELEEVFLRQHGVNMPRTMLRYAIEKFPEPLRRAYLSGSIWV